jgi:hypothetical protein
LRARLSADEAQDLDRIEHYSRQLFEHSRSREDACKDLDHLLSIRHEAGTDIFSLPLKEVADTLQAQYGPNDRPPGKRLTFDDDTHTVTLDGTAHRIDNPKAYAVYKAIVQRETPTIRKAEISDKVKGVSGKKTIPSLIDTLPPALRKTVKRDTTGYWHELPKIR